MFGAILKAINCSFQKGITLCRSIYVTKVMKLLAFIFEQPSYRIGDMLKMGGVPAFCYFTSPWPQTKKGCFLQVQCLDLISFHIFKKILLKQS